MCWKYKNKHDHVFVWCDIANTRRYGASYLRSFSDGIEDYYSHYHYCPFCGKVLQVQGEESNEGEVQRDETTTVFDELKNELNREFVATSPSGLGLITGNDSQNVLTLKRTVERCLELLDKLVRGGSHF